MTESVLKTTVFSMSTIAFVVTLMIIQIVKNYQRTGKFFNKDIAEKTVIGALCISFIIWTWYTTYN